MNVTKPKGIVLLCDSMGLIKTVLNFPSSWGDPPPEGSLWTRLIEVGSLGKALNFFIELQQNGGVYDWVLDVVTSEGVKTVHFSGSKYQENYILVGMETADGSRALLDELLYMQNEQTSLIRHLSAENAERSNTVPLLDEISRLNNELVTAHRELAKKYSELENLNLEKNQLLGIVAHDLRSPLHSIVSVCDFLLEDQPSLTKEGIEIIRMIQSSCGYMAELVDNLLDLSKIESGILNLEFSEVDIIELVTHCIEVNRLSAEKKHLSLTFQHPAEPSILQGDKVKLQQVFHNILANAIKFTHPGGKIHVIVTDTGPEVSISIQDTGVGMTEEEQATLFTASHRGKPGTLGERSTGFGLLIVKRIVEGHHGSLKIESRVGEGSTFIVILPKNSSE
jgi:signal transduction histidine kinase